MAEVDVLTDQNCGGAILSQKLLEVIGCSRPLANCGGDACMKPVLGFRVGTLVLKAPWTLDS